MAKRNSANLRKYKKVCSEIWEEREQTCEECGRFLREARYHNFAHIKGRWTEELLLSKDNIRLLCARCHANFDHKLNMKGGEWLDF